MAPPCSSWWLPRYVANIDPHLTFIILYFIFKNLQPMHFFYIFHFPYAGDLVFQVWAFQDCDTGGHHCNVGHVHPQQLRLIKIASNLQHQVYGYLDCVRTVHTLSYSHSFSSHWTLAGTIECCFHWKLKESTIPGHIKKRSCNNFCPENITWFWSSICCFVFCCCLLYQSNTGWINWTQINMKRKQFWTWIFCALNKII